MLRTGKKMYRMFAAAALAMTLIAGSLTANQSAMDRKKIPAKYKWDLSKIYPNLDAWETGMADALIKIEEIKRLKSTLKKGPDHLLKMITLDEEIGTLFHRVYKYAQFQRDTNMKNQDAAARFQRARNLLTRYRVATAWINPETIALGKEKIIQWLDQSPKLKPYRFVLLDLFRKQTHVLDESKEKLLAFYNEFEDTPAAIYMDMTTADIRFPAVTLSDGRKVKMSGTNFSREMGTNPNRDDRKKAFQSHYGTYGKYQNTYAAIYRSVCLRDRAVARSRNYTSTLEYYLEENDIPAAVYENLVNTARANTGPLKRFHQLRAGSLQLDDYSHYDTMIPLVDFSRDYPYDKVKKWVIASVAPLGKDYQIRVKTAFNNRWIDVYHNAGKRGGAYSSNVYRLHPYILMNYNNTLPNAFTLSHEIGHAIHSQLSSENQTYATHSYSAFAAEVASMFNERLLLEYLLKRTKNPREKIAILQQAIRRLEDTFYYQTMIADFELRAHRLVEQDKPVTADVLNRIIQDLYTDYYGEAVAKDKRVNLVWTRVHHLFRVPYYVFQYATSYAAASVLYEKIVNGPEGQRKDALKRYLTLLKAGGSDAPAALLKKAGVDLTDPAAFQAVVGRMNQLVDQLENELQKL